MSVQPRVDRLSLLPDDLIFDILEFLSTKESIQTTVLSKSWLNKWKMVPSIHLNSLDFTRSYMEHGEKKFCEFLETHFIHSELPTFHSLILSGNIDISAFIFVLVDSMLKKNVSVFRLHFNFFQNDPLVIPLILFSSISLVELVLELPLVLSFPENSLGPQCLKRLVLSDLIIYEDDDAITSLVSSCPSLEQLHIFRTSSSNLERLEIVSMSLKFLQIVLLPEENGVDVAQSLIVECPNLESLEIEDTAIHDIEFVSLDSLLDLKLLISNVHDPDHNSRSYLERLSECLGCVSHLLHLSLGCGTIMDMSYISNLPHFSNLSTLVIETIEWFETDWNWLFFVEFLTHLPVLERLILKGFEFPLDEEFQSAEIQVNGIVYSRLKNVELTDVLVGGSDVDEFFFLLTHSPVLQNVLIRFTSAQGQSIQTEFVCRVKNLLSNLKCRLLVE